MFGGKEEEWRFSLSLDEALQATEVLRLLLGLKFVLFQELNEKANKLFLIFSKSNSTSGRDRSLLSTPASDQYLHLLIIYFYLVRQRFFPDYIIEIFKREATKNTKKGHIYFLPIEHSRCAEILRS